MNRLGAATRRNARPISSTARTALVGPMPRPGARQTTRAGPRSDARHASSGQKPEYEPPTGLLFGEKPLPHGQKRVKESWENIWYYGFYGSLLFGFVMYLYKPDTSLRGWAQKEAEARLKAEGVDLIYRKKEPVQP